MSITDELHRLGNSARRLNAGSDSLNVAIKRIDTLLSRLMIGLEYIHPRPLAERTTLDGGGKRVIELVYVGYLKVDRSYHLAVRTTKVLESRLQLATQAPGNTIALLAAPRQLRFAAVDVLPELVSGLAAQIDEMVAKMNRRQETAESLLRNLEAVADAGESSGRWQVSGEIPAESSSQRSPSPEDSASASASHSASAAASRSAAHRTHYYPGTEEEETAQRSSGIRRTVPIGSGALRAVQKDS